MLEALSDETNIVNKIIRRFYRCSLDYDLKPENVSELSWAKQEEFLNATFKYPLLKDFPVNLNFARLFLKKLIDCLETGQEVHDDLYTYLCLAMKSNNLENFCYKHYIIGNDLNNVVTIKETNNIVVNGTTGMRTWEAAVMLSDWALCNVEVFKKKTVLELGAGVGFTGITIAKFCNPKSILLSDCHDDVLNAIENNVTVNFTSCNRQKTTGSTFFENGEQIIGVMSLDWNDISEFSTETCPDVIIGADIIYDPILLEPLYKVIQHFVKRNEKIEIIIAGVIRNQETLNMFLKLIDSSNLEYRKIHQPKNVYVEWDCNVETFLLKINKKT